MNGSVLKEMPFLTDKLKYANPRFINEEMHFFHCGVKSFDALEWDDSSAKSL